MDANELKAKLHEGEVKFTYRKKDGSERKARGTLCEKLMPKAVPVRKFKCTSIKWDIEDVDGELPKLPSRMTVNIPAADFKGLPEDEVSIVVCDKLTEATGFFVNSYRCEELDIKPMKKLPKGTIFYYDLDKGGFRSFNEDQLIG